MIGLAVHGQEDGRLDQNAAQLAFLGLGQESCQQFRGGLAVLGLADAVLPDENGKAPLVEQVVSRGQQTAGRVSLAEREPRRQWL